MRYLTIVALNDYSKQYKVSLKQLISAWSAFRKAPSPSSLKPFEAQRFRMSQDVATFSLFALQQVLASLGSATKTYLNKQLPSDALIKENDWLINQLIRGSLESPDPFLIEAENTQLKANIDYSIGEHASVLNRMDKPNIVIIDDQASLCTYLCSTLQDFALNTKHFLSVDEFKAAKADIDVDLVLLDIVMPNITQEEVFAFAASLVEQGIKVICCSGKFTFETRLMAVRAKVADYVVKPINTYVLVDKIGRTLGLRNNREHRLVIVDDQESMGEFYKVALEQQGCEVTFFSKAQDMFSVLDDINPDMFLLDMYMPNIDGLEVARMIRQEHKFNFAPILFITADESIENRIAAIKAGAEDVIAKSASMSTITSQIMTRLARSSDIRSFVATDPLTGVCNHGQIVDIANQTIRLCKRRNSQAAIAVIDVDDFKAINDTYGHTIGDKVLTALGQLMSNSIRDSDSVGRYGGEEFVIIFQDCTVKDAAKKVSIIKNVFANLSFTGSEEKFNVTFSAGVADLTACDSVQPAVSKADKALYRAKNEGKNKVIALTENKRQAT